MRLSLDAMDLRGARLEGDVAVSVEKAVGLSGQLEWSDVELRLTDTQAESLELRSLRLPLGTLLLDAATGATFHGVSLSLVRAQGRLSLELFATTVATPLLVLTIGETTARARLVLEHARLTIDGERGALTAERGRLDGLTVEAGKTQIEVSTLVGDGLSLRWGGAGVAFDARTLSGETVSVVSALGPSDREPSSETAGREPPTESKASSGPPVLAWSTLDRLGGHVALDLAVDLTVPILGRRNATHQFRVPISAGTLNFRELEDDLSTLENAILDFAVRDGGLVLERGIPLLPTRGRGKPIVQWDLDEEDLKLAADTYRVRLSVLPNARLVASESPAPETKEPSRSSIALRRLGLLGIDARLSLAPPAKPTAPSAQIELTSVAALSVQGNVFHEAERREESKAGALASTIEGVEARLVGLSLGTSGLSVTRLGLRAATPVELTFDDLRPTRLTAKLHDVALESVALAPHLT